MSIHVRKIAACMGSVLLCALPLTAVAEPKPAERAAVLATIQALFTASTDMDSATMLTLTLPEGGATRLDKGPDGALRVRHLKWTDMAQRPKAFDAKFQTRVEQRLIAPEVRVSGDIAAIWSRYELRIGGKLTRCGVDHFDLIRKDGTWRVLNLTWREQLTGCPNAD